MKMKRSAHLRLFALFLVILSFLCFPLSSRASNTLFVDDFLNIDDVHWIIENNGGSTSVDGGQLSLSSPLIRSYPYVVLRNVIFPEKYEVKIKFRISGNVNYGSGIIFSDRLIPNQTHSDLLDSEFIFQIWPIGRDLSFIRTRLCPDDSSICSETSTPTIITTFNSSNWNEVSIVFDGSKYSLAFNDTVLFQSRSSSLLISKVWFGNPQLTESNNTWMNIDIDYFYIFNSSVKTSTIVIPGFGGSWDIGAILSGSEGTNWQVPSFVINYDGILKSLRNAGYEDGKNLFVFPYDWRKPLDQLANDLDSFISSHDLSKVNLIGHSMGGLVSRAYAQKYGIAKIENILSVGSPHQGVVDAYGLWEGAKIWNGVWWENVLLEIASEINRAKDELKVNAVRRVSPSIIDLFPTYPFLESNNVLIGIDGMYEKNTYLKNLNSDISVLSNKLTAFWSDQISETKNTINVGARSKEDRKNNMWVDGKPVGDYPFENAVGDGTVTKQSAIGPFGDNVELSGWHGDLLSSQSNNQKIFEKLGLDTSLALSSASDNRKNSFVAILRSPGELQVCDVLLLHCNDELGLYFQEFKLFILPGYDGEELIIKVKELGSGGYKLHLGNIDESPDWLVFSGLLKYPGQEDAYRIKYDGNSISATFLPTNKEVCKKNGWSAFRLLGFRNQGDCVSFVERHRQGAILWSRLDSNQ